jgi:hypothetical protein
MTTEDDSTFEVFGRLLNWTVVCAISPGWPGLESQFSGAAQELSLPCFCA